MKENKDNRAGPLLYIVQPDLPLQEAPQMQQVFRTKGKLKRKAETLDEQVDSFKANEDTEINDEDQKKKEEDEKLEKIKHEFGVYDAMKEIADEIAAVNRITGKLENRDQVTHPDGTDRTASISVNPKVNDMIVKLSKLPPNVPKPNCEGIMKGKILNFQVLNTRGDIVIVKEGQKIYDLQISDIDDLRIL